MDALSSGSSSHVSESADDKRPAILNSTTCGRTIRQVGFSKR